MTSHIGPLPLSLFRSTPYADSDPVRFTLRCNQQAVRVGQPVELTITAELLNVSPHSFFFLPGANAYRLKLLLPPGFEQTGGDFADYVGAELSYPSRTVATYHVTGYFSTVTPGTSFRLLRGHGQADNQSLFVEKAAMRLNVRAGSADQTASGRSTESSTLYVLTDAAPAGARAAGSDYRGHLDYADCNRIAGWAFNGGSPNQPVSIDVFINGTKVITLQTSYERQDVADLFGVNGFNKYGYSWTIPDAYRTNTPLTIAVKPSGTDQNLEESPRTTATCVGSAQPPKSQTDPALTPTTSATSTPAAVPTPPISTTTAPPVSTTTISPVSVTATPAPPVVPPANANYRGHLDLASCDRISGWVVDLNASQQAISVDIFINGTKAITLQTSYERQDVADANGIKGFNKYGFAWAVPDAYRTNRAMTVAVRPAGSSRDLEESPRTTALCAGTGQTPDPTPTAPVTPPTSTTTAPVTPPTSTTTTPPVTPPTSTTTAPVTSPTTPVVPPVNANYRGYLDYADCNRIAGWAFNSGSPNQPVSVDVFINGTKVTTLTTDLARQDIADAFGVKGFNKYGYSWTIPDAYRRNAAMSIAVRPSGSTKDLELSPRTTALCAGTGQSTDPTPTAPVTPPTSTTTAPVTPPTSITTTPPVTPPTSTTTAPVTPPTTPVVPPVNANYRGYLDYADCNRVAGWAVDLNAPRQAPSVDVFINGTKVTTLTTDLARQDIADALGVKGFNKYGYSWTIPDAYRRNAAMSIAVRPSGSTKDLELSPRTTALCAGTGQTPDPTPTAPVTPPTSTTTAPVTPPTSTTTTPPVTPPTSTTTAPVTPPTTPVVPPVNANYRGYLDYADCNRVAGWALDLNANQQAISLDIYVNDVKAATVPANLERQDIADVFGIKGFNKYGFSWTIPDSYRSNGPLTIAVKPTGTDRHLTQSPRTTAVCAGTPPTPTTTTGSCGFTITASSVETSCGGSVTLQATCDGPNCDPVTYAWIGNGLTQNGQAITFNAPSANGRYNYTVTATRPGCNAQTAMAVVAVSGCTPPAGNGEYPVLNSSQPDDKRPFLQNGRVRVAIDLGVGGVIREVTDLQIGENMINCMVKSNGVRDPGRDDQISLYGMPDANSGWTQNGKPVIQNIGYNPVQGGDIAGNFAQVLAYGRTDNMLYCKTRGLHWGLNNEPGDYTVEQWIRLDGNVVRRHVRITGDRPDKTRYTDTRQQELPCTYTNSAYYQYYVVQGEPYSNAPLVNVNSIANLGGSGKSLNQHPNRGETGPYNVDASEPWIAAIRPSTGRGLALHTPFSHEFKAGQFGELGWGPAESINAGYMANCVSMILDANGVYEFDVNMVVGTLSEIRNTINTLPRSETKPNYVFAGNPTRHGFYFRKGYDQGFPVGDELVVTPIDRRFRMTSPRKGYRAAEFGTIYIRMRANTPETQMVIDWRKVGQSELQAAQAGQSVTFSITGDNQYRTIAIPVRNNPKWNGLINEFSIRYVNPTETGVSGHELGIKWVSATDLGD